MDLNRAVKLGALEDSVTVAAGRDAKGAIGFIAVVKVESDGHEFFQYGTRRPGVVDAGP